MRTMKTMRSTLGALLLVAALVAGVGAAPALAARAETSLLAQVTPTTFSSATTSPATTAAPAAPVTPATTATPPTVAVPTTVATPPTVAPVTGGTPKDVFRLNGDVTVEPGETVKSVVALNGTVRILGHVTNDVFTANGNIVVQGQGRVDGDAVSLNGDVRTEGSGSIGGQIDTNQGWRDIQWQAPRTPGFGGGASWLFVTLGALGLGVLLALAAPRSLDSVGGEYVHRLGRSALIGFLALFGFPFVLLVLALSVVGIPLAALLVPVAFILGMFGLYALCLMLGRRLLEGFNRPTAGDLWAMVVGVVLIRVILLVPVLSWFLLFVAGTIGFGAVLSRLWDRFQGRRSARPAPGPAPTPPPAPPAVITEVPTEVSPAPAAAARPQSRRRPPRRPRLPPSRPQPAEPPAPPAEPAAPPARAHRAAGRAHRPPGRPARGAGRRRDPSRAGAAALPYLTAG